MGRLCSVSSIFVKEVPRMLRILLSHRNLQVRCNHEFKIDCTALRFNQHLDRTEALDYDYTRQNDISLLSWAEETIRKSLVS